MLPAIQAIPTSCHYQGCYHRVAGYKPAEAKYPDWPDGVDDLDK